MEPRRCPRNAQFGRPVGTFGTPVPQATFPEAAALSAALACGPTQDRWVRQSSQSWLHRAQPRAPHLVEFSLAAYQRTTGLSAADAGPVPNVLVACGIPGAFVLYVCLHHLATSPELDLPLDVLVRASGYRPRTSPQWQMARHRISQILAVIAVLHLRGCRRECYPDRATGRLLDLTIDGPLLHVDGMPLAIAGASQTVSSVIRLRRGAFLERFGDTRAILTDFGDIRPLLDLPGIQPHGAWARSLGLGVQQLLREQAVVLAPLLPHQDQATVAPTVLVVTRGDLLRRFPPQPDPVRLFAERPGRALVYFTAALAQLVRVGVLERWVEAEPPRAIRYDRGDALLQQRIAIVPSADRCAALAQIADGHRRVQSRALVGLRSHRRRGP